MSSKALQLTDSRVRVDLGRNGVYVGELLNLAGVWTGRVRITGVLSPAQPAGRGLFFSRGYRPGEFVDAMPWQLVATREVGHDSYLAALQAQVNRLLGSHSGFVNADQHYIQKAQSLALRAAMIAEQYRAAKGQWFEHSAN